MSQTNKTMSKAAKYSAPALDKGLEILEFLASETKARSQAEIAQGLERTPNELYRVLVVLEARGYIHRDENSGKYRLSLKLYTLSHAHSPVEQMRRAAHQPMLALAEKHGLACYLSVPHEGKLMIASQVKSPHPVSLSIAEGTLFPLLNTTSGKVILANYPKEARKVLLDGSEDWNKLGKKQQQQTLAELENIKEHGYLLAESELTSGISNCSAFVGQAGIGLVAAVNVASLSASIDKQQEQQLIKDVVATAREIDRRIGFDCDD
ncbi:IclR family transcriptional regulator [Agaribacterium haliotis]|uniref:IclR family transcriptional regulator n=1 Tax=Agaribacterium haliotis TaxID=2013869 RepID=UPI001EFE4DAA|nr:IclR family transcriptional regulator [Agaribacterium haliotis]